MIFFPPDAVYRRTPPPVQAGPVVTTVLAIDEYCPLWAAGDAVRSLITTLDDGLDPNVVVKASNQTHDLFAVGTVQILFNSCVGKI